jgi:membrane protease YdiL (CAAX protease family)
MQLMKMLSPRMASETTSPAAPTPVRRLLRSPLPRMMIAAMAVALPVILVMNGVRMLLDKPDRQGWPQLVAVLLAMLAYRACVRFMEQRPACELSGAPAGRELASGAVLGAALILVTNGILLAFGVLQVESGGTASALLTGIPEMALAAVFEELLFRGIVFRIVQARWGRWTGIAASSLLFGLAHAPNDGAGVLAIAVTVVAGILFAAAFMLTGRLWLPIGMHFGWNYLSQSVFALPTSGHAAIGWMRSTLTGPAWLSGGAYGVEGSLVTLLVIALTAAWLLKAALRADARKAGRG